MAHFLSLHRAHYGAEVGVFFIFTSPALGRVSTAFFICLSPTFFT